MMNTLGKGLVLIHAMLALLGLFLAIAVYFEFTDWGRSEPRTVLGERIKGGGGNDQRIASEYDKSVVVFQEAVFGRNLVLGPLVSSPLTPDEAALREAEMRFPQNHLFYVKTLQELREGPGDIEVKALAPDGIPTDTPGKRYGKPVPDVKVQGLDKSLATYRQLIQTEQAKFKDIDEAIRDVAKKDAEVSYQLTGKNEAGKRDSPGIIELIDLEFQSQQLALKEREYVQPQWANIVEQARTFSARRQSLEKTLAPLEKELKARQAKQLQQPK